MCHWETGKAGERGNGVRIFHRMNTASRRIFAWNGMFPIKTLTYSENTVRAAFLAALILFFREERLNFCEIFP